MRDNGRGLLVGATSTTRISDSTVTGNSQGIAIITGATLETRGNNTVRGNRIDVLGSPLTPVGGL